MVQWILSFLFAAMENRGGIYFFDTFLKRKEQKGFLRHQFIIYFVVLYLMAVSDVWIGLLKCIPIILACTFLNLLYYHVSFRQSLIFSVINYAVMVLVDYVILCVCLIISPETGKMAVVGRDYLPALIAKTLWIIILLLIRKCSKSKQNYHLLTGTEFLQFLCIPVFTAYVLHTNSIPNDTGSLSVSLRRACGCQFYHHESDAGYSGQRGKDTTWNIDRTKPEESSGCLSGQRGNL